jgi:hypothetical protein
MTQLWGWWQRFPHRHQGNWKVLLNGVKRLIRGRYMTAVAGGDGDDWEDADLTCTFQEQARAAGHGGFGPEEDLPGC